MTREEKKVILAFSLGTIFEWHDFYLFGSLAAIIAIYYGLWYPVVIALGTFIIGLFFVPETEDRDIYAND
jgi:hypothetical protein